jgi:hypothetical protein
MSSIAIGSLIGVMTLAQPVPNDGWHARNLGLHKL